MTDQNLPPTLEAAVRLVMNARLHVRRLARHLADVEQQHITLRTELAAAMEATSRVERHMYDVMEQQMQDEENDPGASDDE